MIHAFNEKGLAALDPRWAGGRPRLISDDNIEFVVATAATRPVKLAVPFTRWSVRTLACHLNNNPIRIVSWTTWRRARPPNSLLGTEKQR